MNKIEAKIQEKCLTIHVGSKFGTMPGKGNQSIPRSKLLVSSSSYRFLLGDVFYTLIDMLLGIPGVKSVCIQLPGSMVVLPDSEDLLLLITSEAEKCLLTLYNEHFPSEEKLVFVVNDLS